MAAQNLSPAAPVDFQYRASDKPSPAPVGYDASPESALETIRMYAGPVLVDLDETLYLRNSTEDFIDCASPGLPALLLMRVLELLKPWRFTGGEATRDAWRVRLVLFFFPWVRLRWRWRIGELARSHVNRALLDALLARLSPPIIVTSGFASIVKPLIGALGLPEVRVVAARGWGFDDRRRGKLKMAIDALGAYTVRIALVITDSVQDKALLAASALPLRTVWPDARYRRALAGVYLPGEYLTQVKRPAQHYIFRGVLQEDFAFWIIATIGLAALPLPFVGGLLLLLLSFWTIYEAGYVDNDWVAAGYEDEPKLSAQFYDAPVATPRWQPWIWALASGAAAIALIRYPGKPVALDYVKWLAVLVATHACFRFYNRLDKDTRIWVYLLLQFARSAAPLALVAVSPIGAAVLSAQVLARWVPYYHYRMGKKIWPTAQSHLIRILFFLVLSVMLAAALGIHAVFNWTALALLLWSGYHARDELKAVIGSAKRLDSEALIP